MLLMYIIPSFCIVISDARPRKRGYTRKGIRAFYTYTGSHSKTIVYGLLTTGGRGMFRQYNEFNQHTFADFLKQAVYKFKKIVTVHLILFVKPSTFPLSIGD